MQSPEWSQLSSDKSSPAKKHKVLLTSSCLQAVSNETPLGRERHPVVTTGTKWDELQVSNSVRDSNTAATGDQNFHLNGESQLMQLMEKQNQKLEAIQKLLEGDPQGISEQQFRRLEEIVKRNIEEALPAATLQANDRGKTMPFTRTTKEATTLVPTHVSKRSSPPACDDTTQSKPSMRSEKLHLQERMKVTIREIMELRTSERVESDHSWQMTAYQRALSEEGDRFIGFLKRLGMPSTFLTPHSRPDNFLVHVVDMTWFHALTIFAIIANTLFSAYQADESVHMIMQEPPGTPPSWWDALDLGFTIYFIVELVLRMVAFRAYFFFEKGRCIWNMLDLFVCVVSVAATNFDIVFLRLLRIVRLVRLLKVLSETRALAQLRNLLYSVVACMIPLFWAMLFLVMTMLMFTLLILQCISSGMEKVQEDSTLKDEIHMYFYGFKGCVKTLSIAVAGPDWVVPHDILSELGIFPLLVMPVFVVFVNIGVMNVLIGFFADAADGTKDAHSIAEEEIEASAEFSSNMLKLITGGQGIKGEGSIGWEQFKTLFYQEGVQAYLSYHGLDASHVKLVYHLLGGSQEKPVEIVDFILGIQALKGMGKHLDQQVIMHAVQTLLTDMEIIRDDITCLRGSSTLV